jgi:outer membrane protein TolC
VTAALPAPDLANGRYQYQLASIVELTTAQLDEVWAKIDNLTAKYDYEIQYALLQYNRQLR